MTRRLLGPIGGPILFFLVGGLVFAGLGWVTVASLEVERAQQEAAAQAQVGQNLRVALWQLDGRLLPVLGVEDSRPFHHYASSDVVADYGPASAPLLAAQIPDWMLLHFQLSHDIGWDSPQVLPSETVAKLQQQWPGLPLRNVTADRISLLGTLRAKYPTAQAIEYFAARERAIPAGSPPLATPLFLNNGTFDPSAEFGTSVPHSGTGQPSLAPDSFDIAPTAAPAAQEQKSESLHSAASGLKDSPGKPQTFFNDAGLVPATPPAPRAEIPAIPESQTAQLEDLARQSNQIAEGMRAGAYFQRSQSASRAIEEAKKANSFPNQNPLYGGFGPFALNLGKPAVASPPAIPPAATTPHGGLGGATGSGGFGGGFGAASPVVPGSPSPTAGVQPPGLLSYGGGGAAGPTPGPVAPATSTAPASRFSSNGADSRRESNDPSSLTRGAGSREYSFEKQVEDKGLSEKERLAKKIEQDKDVAKSKAAKPGYYPPPGIDGADKFGMAADRAWKKEAEEGAPQRKREPGAGGEKAFRDERKPDGGPVPAAPPAGSSPAKAMWAIAGGPIASALLNPRSQERALAADGTDLRGLARGVPALPPPAPFAARPSTMQTEPAPKDAEPMTLTPDPAPPAVLEPVPALPWRPFTAADGITPAVAVHLGSMRPQWLTAADGSELLVLVRTARLEDQTIYQGVVLDWPRLQTVLKEEVKELFPDAKLVAVKDPSGVSSERAMTALPVQLDPGPPPPLPQVGWTPLRLGLVMAWTAAIIAFVAVGLCGWSLIDLSERRIRFVSAVTHELRTPLTALRLYLDLLLSGMVQDEEKRREYLSTLNAESDRLHRLIDNVLDFARLERQRKGNAIQTVKVADLLDQVRVTWTDRCGTDHKELVVISTLPAEAEVSTDPLLVQQIVGNLIDNARKYTRDAEDNHIWVWVKPGGRWVVFEVEDRGSGIPARERSLIFRPFRRGESADTKAGGAGLGLALSKQWAEVLGGRLTYHPADGGTGSCFRLELRVK